MTEDIRGQLISQLTNLKKQNKKTVSLDIDFVLRALMESDTMPVLKKPNKIIMDADAGKFRD